jgi:hypothetical protein
VLLLCLCSAGGGGGDDEDGDGEVGGSSRGRGKRGRAKEDDVEEGQDLPGEQEVAGSKGQGMLFGCDGKGREHTAWLMLCEFAYAASPTTHF